MPGSKNDSAINETLFQQIFEEAPQPYHVADFGGRLCAVNQAWLQLLGYQRDDVIGRPVKDFISPEYLSQFEDSFKRLSSGKPVPRRIVEMLRANGTTVVVEAVIRADYDQENASGHSYCLLRDITGPVAAADGLRRSEEQLRHLFDNAPVSLWSEDFSSVKVFINELKSRGIVDLKQHFLEDQRDFQKCLSLVKIKSVNQATLDLFKASSMGELTANLATTFTEDGAKVFLHELVALADGLSGAEAVTTLRTLDGELRHVAFKLFRDLADDSWETVYVAFMDLTPTRQIQDLNARLVTAIEQTGDSVIVTDPDGNVLYCNPAFEKVSGYTSDEVMGQNLRLLKSGHHEDAFYKALWDTINQGTVWVGNFINRRKDGSVLEEEASISPVMNDNGEIISFVSVKRDVTLHNDMERRLVQSQKMEAVGQLAGGVAHDFNNILHAMLGHLEFALDEETEPGNVQRELGLLRNSVGRASQLTRQLLAFSRRQVLELQNVD
ncbi:MAG: PAS domain S-box protein, partial [Candidatus Krumholzibacteria bacterium]|nr:PAS domain S-box protein [Candidatus Krumholzibacteria bacterium]